MMKKNIYILFSLFVCLNLNAQIQQDIYPEKKGTELLGLLVTDYKPSSTLSYNAARDELWGAVAKRNQDSLSCVYTDYTIYISPSASNPRTEAYNKGINCEHTWPQSLGATDQAKSDMHHLYPTREDVNGARGNLAFGDIDDINTDKWFWLNQQKTTIPVSSINQYSEVDNNKWFEVREDHKGNVARAMMYFYTMYKNQSDASFFSKQKENLYFWHLQDPVDVDEEWRNNFIASKQGGHHNPFIQDSTLIRRAYFPNYTGWTEVGMKDEHVNFQAFVNNKAKSIEINFESELKNVQVNIYNFYGQRLESIFFNNPNSKISISTNELVPAIYLIQISTNKYSHSQKVNINH